MKIKKLPQGLRELALEQQVAQGNEPNDELDLVENPKEGNFNWNDTPQGYGFWNYVREGKFEKAKKIYDWETMKKPHKHKDEIIAWANGAEIEIYNKLKEEWQPRSRPLWAESKKYRIKPQPKLVPFSLPEDAEKIIGKAVVSKEAGGAYLITGVYKGDEKVSIDGSWVKPENLLARYIFLDGSPCGKYVEE